MPWVRIEAAMPEGAKFTSAPSSVGWLYITAMCWTARTLTDGFIPKAQVYRLTNDHPKIVDAAVGFLTTVQPGAHHPAWEVVEGGFQIRHYADPQYGNPTRAGQAALSEAGRKGGLRSGEVRREGGASSRLRTEPEPRPAPPHVSPTGDTPRLDVEELCEVMQMLVTERAKRPEITKAWREDARLMLDRDQRPLFEALSVMRWAARDSFWRSNVLSIPTFRKQYDKLKLAMERPRKNGHVDERIRNLLDNPLPALVSGHD